MYWRYSFKIYLKDLSDNIKKRVFQTMWRKSVYVQKFASSSQNPPELLLLIPFYRCEFSVGSSITFPSKIVLLKVS